MTFSYPSESDYYFPRGGTRIHCPWWHPPRPHGGTHIPHPEPLSPSTPPPTSLPRGKGPRKKAAVARRFGTLTRTSSNLDLGPWSQIGRKRFPRTCARHARRGVCGGLEFLEKSPWHLKLGGLDHDFLIPLSVGLLLFTSSLEV